MKRIKIFTFGCKANQYDTQLFIELLSKMGYEVNEGNYDIAIINSCCVTKKAEKEVKRFIGRAIHGGKDVWITGCLIEKDNLKTLFPQAKILPRKTFYEQARSLGVSGITEFHGHTRAFVKIVDGCENFCSYCIVPYVRGRISSRSVSDIVNEIRTLVRNSYHEIVFTGIDLGSFGKDTDQSLIKLLEEISDINGLYRFRLSSIEVYHLTDELLEILCNCDKFCPSFHIPLQSGSDRILRLMKRPYCFNDYITRIESIRYVFGDITFTTDIMVGFPGETETEFEKTIEAICKCGFLKVHAFPFSLHSQTLAAGLPEKVSECTKKERLKKVIDTAEAISKDVKKSFIGKKCKVLIEEKMQDFWFGFSQHYVQVLIDSSEDLKGKMVDVIPEEMIKMRNNIYLLARTILP